MRYNLTSLIFLITISIGVSAILAAGNMEQKVADQRNQSKMIREDEHPWPTKERFLLSFLRNPKAMEKDYANPFHYSYAIGYLMGSNDSYNLSPNLKTNWDKMYNSKEIPKNKKQIMKDYYEIGLRDGSIDYGKSYINDDFYDFSLLNETYDRRLTNLNKK